jgi:inorganic pyrophosphatase
MAKGVSVISNCLSLFWIHTIVSGEYAPKINPRTFELWRLKIEKKVKTTERAHRLQFLYRGQIISPWHDIPFQAGYFGEETQPLLHFVCEIPRMTHAKLEIHKGHAPNPLIQDIVGNNKLRFYKYGESIVNYGAIAQTWEDPNVEDPDTGMGGDNDPIDVLQLNSKPCRLGAVQRVRVLGALALMDGGETDWKLLVVNVDDGTETAAITWRNVGDIPDDLLGEIRQWFKMYKTAEGKSENVFALDGKAVDADHALRVAQRTHKHWRDFVDGNSRCFTNCDGRHCNCWVGADDGADL